MDFPYLDNLAGAYAESRILHAAVELNIFDTIGDKGMSTEDAAAKLHTDERATGLILNALTAMSLMEKEDNLFYLNDLSDRKGYPLFP